MLNAIITGHGEFSLGILHALEMIGGKQEKMKAIPFFDSDTMESYQGKIKDTLSELSGDDDESNVIIFTDLMGGTPFNVSMLLTEKMPNVTVMSGTNLPMLLEFVVQRWSEDSVEEVIDRLIDSAHKGIEVGKLNFQEKKIEEDGI